MFKNIISYRFNKPFEINAEQLESDLSEFSFSPCSSQDASKFGFSSADLTVSGNFVRECGIGYLICATKEEKILPSQVIKDCVDEKVEAIEHSEGRKVTKKERDAIKDEAVMDLLPKAFTRSNKTMALIIPRINMILIDSSSYSKAESLLALLRKAIGSLPVVPLCYNKPVEQTLTEWLSIGAAPAPFEMQDEAELKSDSSDGGIIRIKHHDLTEDEVLSHLETGKQVHKLSLCFGQSATFVMNSDCSIKRLKFSEEFRAANDDVGNEDPSARFDADLELFSQEIELLVTNLAEAVGGIESE